ncbi:MAG: MBL fold metallo-hydrolase [Endomicrobiaceae bacterium]|nr:MBL fold metallo-hydrolase [Endomicrobiaceae bacterium]
MIKNTVYKSFFAFIFLLVCNFAYAQISVEYFGGAGQVSGSCALLKVGDNSVIIDCGTFYDEGDDNSIIDKKLISADAMVLTHAHNDHSGRILQLINEGFKGKVYCTDATKKIIFEMYDDGWNYDYVKKKYFWSKSKREKIQFRESREPLTLHWHSACKSVVKNIEECKSETSLMQLKKKYGINFKVCKNCLIKDLEKLQDRFISVEYKDNIDITDKINFSLYNAGHISGSASVIFYVYDENKIKTVAFSGDLGSGYSKLTPDKDIIPKVDYVFAETTYGGAKKNVSNADYQKFQEMISSAVKNNKIVWIPSLSLHRTQKVLFEIKQAQLNGLIPYEVPVYSLSPSSNGITDRYEKEVNFPSRDRWLKNEVYQTGSFLPEHYITKMPKEIPAPSIIISASGMMDQGVSYSLIKRLLPLKTVEVCLVSYAGPATPAGKLKKGAKYIRVGKNSVKVEAKINIFDIFSDHPDIDELMKWLSNQDSATKIYLVHGEKDTLNKALALYKQKGFPNTKIAIKGINLLQ